MQFEQTTSQVYHHLGDLLQFLTAGFYCGLLSTVHMHHVLNYIGPSAPVGHFCDRAPALAHLFCSYEYKWYTLPLFGGVCDVRVVLRMDVSGVEVFHYLVVGVYVCTYMCRSSSISYSPPTCMPCHHVCVQVQTKCDEFVKDATCTKSEAVKVCTCIGGVVVAHCTPGMNCMLRQ